MKKLIVLIVLNGLFVHCFSQNRNSVLQELTNDLAAIYARGHIVGFSVSIVNQDDILYQKGFGYSNKKNHKAYTENTIQNIASISKTFIGIALLKAQELGKLDLDDPINKYLPFEVTNPLFQNTPITIRHLATHTSSIQDPKKYEKNGYVLKDKNNGKAKVNRNFRSPDHMMDNAVFLKNILCADGNWYKESTFLESKPGALFEYSNIAAGLAAYVLENATGISFTDFTQEHILKPLGMTHSGWSFRAIDFANHSTLYADNKTELAFYRLVTYPDGGLITSATDMGNYMIELISGYSGNGKILSNESYLELFKSQLDSSNYTERRENTYNDEYNMGIFMGISAQGQIGHTGGDPGVVTFMFFNTKTKIGKLLILNTNIKKEGTKEFIDLWQKLEEYESKL